MYKERQKATRALKKLKRRLDASSPETSDYTQLAKEVHDAEIDMNYTIYHPLTEKYQSLFPRQDVAGGEERAARKLVTEKPAVWKVVERCTADGTLEALRDGKVETGMIVGKKKPAGERPKSKRKGKNDRAGSKLSEKVASQEQDEGSDGGFFEK